MWLLAIVSRSPVYMVLFMSISRDEAREIAIVGILATIVLRVGAGVLQLIDDLGVNSSLRSLSGRLFAPIGSTVGMLALAAVLLVVLSPSGSITPAVVKATRRMAGFIALLGIAAAFHTLALGYSQLIARLWFAMINGLAAATLGTTAWWILKHFDDGR